MKESWLKMKAIPVSRSFRLRWFQSCCQHKTCATRPWPIRKNIKLRLICIRCGKTVAKGNDRKQLIKNYRFATKKPHVHYY